MALLPPMYTTNANRRVGYRALSTNVNFSNGGPYTSNLDLVIHGPLIGLTLRFTPARRATGACECAAVARPQQ